MVWIIQSTPSISYRPQHHDRRCNFDSFVDKRGAKGENRSPLVFALHKRTPQLPNPSVVVIVVVVAHFVPRCRLLPVLFRKHLEELVRRRSFKLCNTSLLTGKYIYLFFQKKDPFYVSCFCLWILSSWRPGFTGGCRSVERFPFFLSNLFVHGCVSRLWWLVLWSLSMIAVYSCSNSNPN